MTSKRLNLSVQYACNQGGLPSRPQIRAWVRAALDVDEKRGGQITIRFVEPEEGQSLNNDYREKDYATNVLSFPAELPAADVERLLDLHHGVLQMGTRQGIQRAKRFIHQQHFRLHRQRTGNAHALLHTA